MTTLCLSALSAGLIVGGILLMRRLERANDREREAGTFANRFIYINEDGSARALSPDERSYLNTKFHPTDGNRPYIKSRYGQRTPDGKISGYLLKKRLPRRIPVDG
jgi:hypothetical protein